MSFSAGASRAGKIRGIVGGIEEDLRGIIEYLLRAVSMMVVPVDDQNSATVVDALAVPGGYGYGVEVAVSVLAALVMGMMTGGADRTEGIGDFAAADGVDGTQGAADRGGGCLGRSTQTHDGVDMPGRMYGTNV